MLTMLRHTVTALTFSPMFGGEDLLAHGDDRTSWRHRAISERAALEAGWSVGAADELSWHAHHIDSYLYNPFWWLGQLPRLRRRRAGHSLQGVLSRIHFDDLHHTTQVRTQWKRYLGGTLAGLLHVATTDQTRDQKIAAMRHLTGLCLHAIQDFYAHTSWLTDPNHHDRLWTDLSPVEQAASTVFSGSAHGSADGPAAHGNISVGLPTRNRPRPSSAHANNSEAAFDEPASGERASDKHAAPPTGPAQRVSSRVASAVTQRIPDHWRSTPVGEVSIRGVKLPHGLLRLRPAGIAFDTTWQAVVAVQERGLPAASAADMFSTAVDLAHRESVRTLHTVGAAMADAGYGDLWHSTATAPATSRVHWHNMFELPGHELCPFPASGTYPPPADPTGPEWYIRIELHSQTTRTRSWSPAALRVEAAGKRTAWPQPTDLPNTIAAALRTNDSRVLHVGPFSAAPRQVTLYNDGADQRISSVTARMYLLDDGYVGLAEPHTITDTPLPRRGQLTMPCTMPTMTTGFSTTTVQ